jgi:hypothetical protein
MLLQLSITLLEASITLLESIHSTGSLMIVTNNHQNIFIVQAAYATLPPMGISVGSIARITPKA